MKEINFHNYHFRILDHHWVYVALIAFSVLFSGVIVEKLAPKPLSRRNKQIPLDSKKLWKIHAMIPMWFLLGVMFLEVLTDFLLKSFPLISFSRGIAFFIVSFFILIFLGAVIFFGGLSLSVFFALPLLGKRAFFSLREEKSFFMSLQELFLEDFLKKKLRIFLLKF